MPLVIFASVFKSPKIRIFKNIGKRDNIKINLPGVFEDRTESVANHSCTAFSQESYLSGFTMPDNSSEVYAKSKLSVSEIRF